MRPLLLTAYIPFNTNELVVKFGLRHSPVKSLLSRYNHSKTQPLNVTLCEYVSTTSDIYDKLLI